MIDQWPCSLCLPLCSYGRVYATADPYHHTIGPAATYSVGTMVSLWERRPVSVCTPCETSQHDNATHTHDSHTHTLQKIKTRGCSSRWFLFMCLFINWFSFLSCYLAHPAGAEQHCKEKKKNPACWKWLRQLNVTPCKLTSCNINLTRVSSWNENEWLLQRFWKTFASLHNKRTFSCSSYITRLAAEWVGSSSLFLLFFFPPHSAKPNLMKGWSWIVNVCF